MLKKFFALTLVLFFMGGCVGTVKIADAPSKNIKGTSMQTKVDNNSTKK